MAHYLNRLEISVETKDNETLVATIPPYRGDLKEDIDLVKSLPPSLPHLCFFRHHKGYGGIKPGTKMERDVLYRYWKKACKNLGIENVDMYGGTRHSSAVDLRRFYSPEQIKNATMHSTNKAFERYFQIQLEDIRKIYQTSSGKKLVKEF